MSEPSPTGLMAIASNHSVDETVSRLLSTLSAKGATVFAVIDHSGEAEKVGIKMPATKLVIFGNPRGGTPLMLASPGIAIDLPLKLLIAEDAAGAVTISWNTPEYLAERHHLPEPLIVNIAVVAVLATAVAE